MELEACVEHIEEAKLAAYFKLDRVELCQGLDLGGLTPTYASIENCAKYIKVHALLRPRPGNFIYSAIELKWMVSELKNIKKAGAYGVVWGCLDENDQIDLNANMTLMKWAKRLNLVTTFHRAFDAIEHKEKALESLSNMGFDRILTSGGKSKIDENLEILEDLVSWKDERLEIMAGGGIDESNASKIKETGVDAIHFSINKKVEGEDLIGMGSNSRPDTDKLEKILRSLRA